MPESPDFSRVSEAYSVARPAYPAELFAWLGSVAPAHEFAWDAATGSGQAAVGLATHFARVIATDHSKAQLRHARPHPRVEYRVAPAEASGLPDRSADLITAAAAVHWFDRPRFYGEARRVARPGGVLAAWTYHVAHCAPPFDAVFGPFYRDVVAPYFSPAVRLVDGRYESLELPGSPLAAPAFVMAASWTRAQLLEFVRTWSGVQSWMDATGGEPEAELAPRLDEVFGSEDASLPMRWPLYTRASRL